MPGGRVAYIVSGSTDTYAVEIDVFKQPSSAPPASEQCTSAEAQGPGPPRHFCTCPAFAYSFLLRNSMNEDLSPSMVRVAGFPPYLAKFPTDDANFVLNHDHPPIT